MPETSELLFQTPLARMETSTPFQKPLILIVWSSGTPTWNIPDRIPLGARPKGAGMSDLCDLYEFLLILLFKLQRLQSSYTHINPMRIAFQKRKLRFREAQKLGQCCGGKLRFSSQQADVSYSLSALRHPFSYIVSVIGCSEDSVAALFGTTHSDPSGCMKTASRPRILGHPRS